jgi:hypothetical protein
MSKIVSYTPYFCLTPAAGWAEGSTNSDVGVEGGLEDWFMADE